MTVINKTTFHVGVIMDGNRRWAKAHKKTNIEAYKIGAEVAKEIFNAAFESKFISHLTLWVLSSDNFQKRPKIEINFILSTIADTIIKDKEQFISNNVYLEIVGDTSILPERLFLAVKEIQQKVVKKDFYLYLAVNYSGRKEILNAANNCFQHNRSSSFISEEEFCSFLYAKTMPNVDLVIRTGNRNSLSGFLLWRIDYAELVFLQEFWPDFNKKTFLDVIEKFNSSLFNRKFGK